MKFTPLAVDGARLIEHEPIHDERGWFGRWWCKDEIAAAGLQADAAQINQSWSRERGTLRGMHWMAAPNREAKTLSVLRGHIYDVIADIRWGSPTFLQWCAVELRAGDDRAVHVPAGCAHGFLTLCDDTLIQYLIAAPFQPSAYRGMRWDDPRFGIHWPEKATVMHPRDASFPDFTDDDATRF